MTEATSRNAATRMGTSRSGDSSRRRSAAGVRAGRAAGAAGVAEGTARRGAKRGVGAAGETKAGAVRGLDRGGRGGAVVVSPRQESAHGDRHVQQYGLLERTTAPVHAARAVGTRHRPWTRYGAGGLDTAFWSPVSRSGVGRTLTEEHRTGNVAHVGPVGPPLPFGRLKRAERPYRPRWPAARRAWPSTLHRGHPPLRRGRHAPPVAATRSSPLRSSAARPGTSRCCRSWPGG